jgi:hypothetical protein
MKKILKRFILLTFVTALFVLSSTTIFADYSRSVLTSSDENHRFYEYQPAHQLEPGHAILLGDFINPAGYYPIPKGKLISFFCNLDYLSTLHIEVRNLNGRCIYDTRETGAFSFTLPPVQNDTGYNIILTNEGSNTVSLLNYCIVFYPTTEY